MANILELFNQKEVLNYLKAREYPKMLGDELFPNIKRPTLEFEMIKGAGNKPVIASVHGFDTEAEIGSREAQKQVMELALIKRKLQLSEKEIIALEQPRNAAEKEYLMKEVYNDIDVLVQGVLARVEAMKMEILANGTVTLQENNLNAVLDYGIPTGNKEVLAGTNQWTNTDSDPIKDMLRWVNLLSSNPTRALTSNTILYTLLTHPKVKSALVGNNTERIPSVTELNSYLQQMKLPVIATYDEQYRKQGTDGKYTQHRYFPEDKFVMIPSGELGHGVFGPTAEEIRLTRDPSIQTSMIGNVLAMVYEENLDPVSTWTKAVATALPSFPYGDEVFQAKVI